MVPGTASLGGAASEEQTDLREAAKDYVELSESEDWVQRASLLGFARLLVDGVSGENETETGYSGAIDASTADPQQVIMRLSADIDLARNGLAGVTDYADAFIETMSPEAQGLRTDVTSYERALVAAQKSRRSFADALTRVAERTDEGVAGVDGKLAEFDAVIDEARKTADILADLYASVPTGAAVS
ncbi:MAG: hypothetical protein AAGA24_01125 [Pseudomonadota bacterium]